MPPKGYRAFLREDGTMEIRNCSRCGIDFESDSKIRICLLCRKPRLRDSAPFSKTITLRDQQILKLICQGKSNKEIASALYLAEGTIKQYIAKLFIKAAVPNRTALAVWELQRGA